MLKIGTSVVLALMLVGGGGCATPYSEAPLATNFATTKQKQLQAGAHWKVIADDLAKTVSAKAGSAQSIYLTLPPKTAFNQAFYGLILTSLVNQGVNVVKQPAAADMTVDIDTQIVKFSANRPQYNYVGAPTALASGAWALHSAGPAHWATSQVLGGVAVAAVAVDALTWFHSEFATGATPQNEIFVTVTASDKNRYLARTSTVYYVADSDQGLYAAAPVAKSINVYGDR